MNKGRQRRTVDAKQRLVGGEDDDVTEKGNFVIELLIKNRP